MATKQILKDVSTGEEIYPVTHESCIVTKDGTGVATKGQLDEANSAAAEAARKVFDDLWVTAVGVWGKIERGHMEDGVLKEYYLNKLWLTYEEALAIFIAGPIDTLNIDYRYANAKIKTNLPPVLADTPPHGASTRHFIASKLLDENSELETFLVPENFSIAPFSQYSGSYVSCKVFNSPYLKEIIGEINCGKFEEKSGCAIFGARCELLESVKLKLINADMTLKLPKMNAESVNYAIRLRYPLASGGKDLITLTFHADVYAKITAGEGEWAGILDLAAEKNVSIASA